MWLKSNVNHKLDIIISFINLHVSVMFFWFYVIIECYWYLMYKYVQMSLVFNIISEKLYGSVKTI